MEYRNFGSFEQLQPDYGFDVISEAFQQQGCAPQKDTTPDSPAHLGGTKPGQPKGPSTYLHAGAGKSWPHDQKAEDTFEVPKQPWSTPEGPAEEREYRAEFGPCGGAFLVLDHTTIVANFNNFADAQTAAKALNELKGY